MPETQPETALNFTKPMENPPCDGLYIDLRSMTIWMSPTAYIHGEVTVGKGWTIRPERPQ